MPPTVRTRRNLKELEVLLDDEALTALGIPVSSRGVALTFDIDVVAGGPALIVHVDEGDPA